MKIDSLYQALSRPLSDTDRMKTIYRLGSAYVDVNLDSALFYAEDALLRSRSLKFKKGEALALTLKGNIFLQRGDYPAAFERYVQSLKTYEQLNFQDGIASAYNNMALVLVTQRDYEKATENYMQAIKFYKKLKNNNDLLQAYINIGDCYEKMNKLEEALSYLNKANELAFRIDDKVYKGQILTNLGNLYSRMDMKEVAKSFYKQSIPILERNDDKQFLTETYYGMSRIFEDNNELDSSIHYARISLAVAKEFNYPSGILIACKQLSKSYAQLKNTDSAYTFLQAATIIQDTLSDEKTIREVDMLNLKEQIRQESLAEERKRQEHERTNNLQMLAIVIFLVTLFGVLILWSKKKMRPKYVRYLGLIGLLMTFEFISIFLHPFVAEITHHMPALMLITFVSIAFILVPMHHKMEHWVEEKLAHRRKRVYTPRRPTVKKIAPATETQKSKDHPAKN